MLLFFLRKEKEWSKLGEKEYLRKEKEEEL